MGPSSSPGLSDTTASPKQCDGTSNKSDLALWDCPICLDRLSFASGIVVAVLTCGHSYHESCVRKLVSIDGSQKLCPICSQVCISSGWVQLCSTSSCLVCNERFLESPSKTMEVVAPDRNVIHTECLQLLRHTDPFRVDETGTSSYKLWGTKSIRIKTCRHIYCFDQNREDQQDLLFTQRTFAEDVAACVVELEQAAALLSVSKGKDSGSAVASLRKLRILAAACCKPSGQQLSQDDLQDARLPVFLVEGAVSVATNILRMTEENNAFLWRQTAEFLAESCFRSVPNSVVMVKTGTFQAMLLRPKGNNAFLLNFVYQSLSGQEGDGMEPPLVQAGAIELVVRLLKEDEYNQEIKIRLVDLLAHCRHYPARLFSSGGIALLRRHGTDLKPQCRNSRHRAIVALETIGIRGRMILDERIDFCHDLSQVYGLFNKKKKVRSPG